MAKSGRYGGSKGPSKSELEAERREMRAEAKYQKWRRSVPDYKPRKGIKPSERTPTRTFELGTELRLPGNVTGGSRSFYRKASMLEMGNALREIEKRYSDIIRRLRLVTPEAIQDAMMPAYLKSKVYVPKDTGALLDSADMGHIEMTSGRVRGYIRYGNAIAWYAALVHEFTWLNHKSPTRSKYLQAAMEEEYDNFLSRLAVSYALGKVWA